MNKYETPDTVVDIPFHRPIRNHRSAVAKVDAPAPKQRIQPVLHIRPRALLTGTQYHPDLLLQATYIAIKDYLKRWSIETLFGCLKSRGFNFESTHLKKLERIEKLMALLAIAFCWCHLSGEWRNSEKPVKIKKHGRLAVSIFRYGLDLLREALLNTSFRSKVLGRLIQVFEERFLLPAESQLSAA